MPPRSEALAPPTPIPSGSSRAQGPCAAMPEPQWNLAADLQALLHILGTNAPTQATRRSR
jgi:hypothetical protein